MKISTIQYCFEDNRHQYCTVPVNTAGPGMPGPAVRFLSLPHPDYFKAFIEASNTSLVKVGL